MPELPNLVEDQIKAFRKDATMLENMAGIYPGDPTGEISRDIFILRCMADILADAEWADIMWDYSINKPAVEVTVSAST